MMRSSVALRAFARADEAGGVHANRGEMVRQADELRSVDSAVRRALANVHDPEIPPLSIVDLGIVERIDVIRDEVRIDLLPTFAGGA